jgi:hypothetical protein
MDDRPDAAPSALEDERLRKRMNKHEAASPASAFERLGVVRKVEVERFIIEALAFVIDLDFEKLSSARYPDEGYARDLGFVAMHNRIHEEFSDDEEESIAIPLALSVRELSYALQDRGYLIRL